MKRLLVPLFLLGFLPPFPHVQAAREKHFKKRDREFHVRRDRHGTTKEKVFRHEGKVSRVRTDPDRSVTQKTRVTAAASETITISGRRTQPVKLSGKTGATIRFAPGASLQGNGSGNGIELVKCRSITVQGPGEVRNWNMGVRIAESGAAQFDNIRLNKLQVLKSKRQGLLSINSCGISVTGGRWEAGSDHAIYFSNFNNGTATSHCRVTDAVLPGRSGNFLFQTNSEGGKAKATLIEVKGCSIGTQVSERAVNLLGVDITFTTCKLSGRIHADKTGSKTTKAILKNCAQVGVKQVGGGSALVVQ